MSNRVSQLPVEVLVLSDVPIPARLSQLPLEVLRSATPEITFARLSQLPLEVLIEAAAASAAQLSQLPVEVLSEAPLTPASETAVTQAALELAHQQLDSTVEATQAALELAHQQLDSAVDATQAVLEVGWQQPGALHVTQLLIEIIRAKPLENRLSQLPLEVLLFIDQPDLDTECVDASTRLVNMALARLGITDTIPNLATDISRQAETARQHYADEIDVVLRAHPWKFATRYARLPWVAGSLEAPLNDDWTYSYRLPGNCLMVRRIVPADGRQRLFDPAPVPFDTTEDPAGGLLSANVEAVEIEYTARIVCPARVRDPLFRVACTWRLAHAFAPALARDKTDVVSTYARYLEQIELAQARDQGEQQPQSPPHVGDAEWNRGRQ